MLCFVNEYYDCTYVNVYEGSAITIAGAVEHKYLALKVQSTWMLKDSTAGLQMYRHTWLYLSGYDPFKHFKKHALPQGEQAFCKHRHISMYIDIKVSSISLQMCREEKFFMIHLTRSHTLKRNCYALCCILGTYSGIKVFPLSDITQQNAYHFFMPCIEKQKYMNWSA